MELHRKNLGFHSTIQLTNEEVLKDIVEAIGLSDGLLANVEERRDKTVPRWVYLTNPYLNGFDLNVEAGGSTAIEIMVPVADTRIVWQVWGVTNPVTLMLMPPDPPPPHDTAQNKRVKPRPIFATRLQGIDSPQRGAVSCVSVGIHRLLLDNIKDMIHAVRAKAKIEVIPPLNFLSKYGGQTALGDMIDFYKPVTPAERAKREEMVLACETYPPGADQNGYH
ncbi:hypothetical protein PoB_001701200 [Plakobranchus ocellatus]|uniref:Uncharacterized protein n=1 Tax=Plakobranchus ocellatus TaxID=259542 RepID=A0AAV3Z7M2_9GAST|nr:hypothetical protein PoB_001701200 [Plakobranchus ocellatus]